MKAMKVLTFTLFITLAGLAAFAQKSEVPDVSPILKQRVNTMRTYRIPNFTVIQSHNKQYNIAPEGLKLMKAEWVTTTKVLNDSTSKEKYGEAARNGVSVCVLDDNAHPEAFTKLKPWLTPLKPKS